MNRDERLASIAEAKDAVAKLEAAIAELQQQEHAVTREIENAAPQDSIAPRMKRAAILEAVADAGVRLGKAREWSAARERDLEVHDANEQAAELTAEYNGLLKHMHLELDKLRETMVRMDEIAAKRGWLEKAVIRANGDFTNSYFLRPTGAVAFWKSGVQVVEKRYAEFPEGLQD